MHNVSAQRSNDIAFVILLSFFSPHSSADGAVLISKIIVVVLMLLISITFFSVFSTFSTFVSLEKKKKAVEIHKYIFLFFSCINVFKNTV